jgi:hypothetical protein
MWSGKHQAECLQQKSDIRFFNPDFGIILLRGDIFRGVQKSFIIMAITAT